MQYREFMNNIDKKILRWNYAIPIGIVGYIISKLLGGTSTLIGAAVGTFFSWLIIIGLFLGIATLIKYLLRKIK